MRKEVTNTARAASELQRMYRRANETFFKGKLGEVIITLKNSANSYGHVSVGEIWTVKDDHKRELNISTCYLSRPIEEVCATLLHEMSHIWAMENGIKDTSRGNTYHNKKFKEIAEGMAKLKISHDSRIGWSVTEATEDTINFCIANDFADFKLCDLPLGFGRGGAFGGSGGSTTGTTGTGTTRKPSSTRKYKCPCCGNSVRATKDLNIICGDCNEQMVKV